MEETDLLLIGAGPSNIALAVALEELGSPSDVGKALMLEAGSAIGWHPGMMFTEAQSQVSFLKDLATLRDPTSAFTFLNFLHKTGRLDDFVNLQTFFPYRREISAYLRWCASRLQKVEVRYGAAVVAIQPVLDGTGNVQRWQITCGNGSSYMARRIVYGAGRQAHIPEPFGTLKTPRVLHASRFLGEIGRLDPALITSVAVVGGAQSSAEVFQECAQRFPQAEVNLLMRSVGMKPYGGSRFTNQLYGFDFVDHFYDAPEQARQDMLNMMRDSNYAGVTPSMLETLFRQQYLQRLDKSDRVRIHTQCQFTQARLIGERVVLDWTEGHARQACSGGFDVVVLGTGYRNQMPQLLQQAVEPMAIQNLVVDRNYRAALPSVNAVSLHILGVNESTHGISDTLLSVSGTRAKRVLADMCFDRERWLPAGQESNISPSIPVVELVS